MHPRFIHRSESGPGVSQCCSSWVMTQVCPLYFTQGCWSHLPLPRVTVTGRAICLLPNLSGSHERGDWRLACGTHTLCQLTSMAHSSLPYGATTYVQRGGRETCMPIQAHIDRILWYGVRNCTSNKGSDSSEMTSCMGQDVIGWMHVFYNNFSSLHF